MSTWNVSCVFCGCWWVLVMLFVCFAVVDEYLECYVCVLQLLMSKLHVFLAWQGRIEAYWWLRLIRPHHHYYYYYCYYYYYLCVFQLSISTKMLFVCLQLFMSTWNDICVFAAVDDQINISCSFNNDSCGYHNMGTSADQWMHACEADTGILAFT